MSTFIQTIGNTDSTSLTYVIFIDFLVNNLEYFTFNFLGHSIHTERKYNYIDQQQFLNMSQRDV